MMPMQQYQPAPMQQMPQGGYYGQSGLAQQTQQIQYAAPARSYASGDRLPAMPEMMQRPVAPVAQQLRQPTQQPMVRGGAPEVAQQPINPPAPSSPGWQPIRIPSPAEMGIATTVSLPAKPEVAMPAQYDLTTVTNWLDQQDIRHMQRKKLPEGYQFSCQVDEATPAIIVRGVTEAEALQQLVREVVKQKQNMLLSQR